MSAPSRGGLEAHELARRLLMWNRMRYNHRLHAITSLIIASSTVACGNPDEIVSELGDYTVSGLRSEDGSVHTRLSGEEETTLLTMQYDGADAVLIELFVDPPASISIDVADEMRDANVSEWNEHTYELYLRILGQDGELGTSQSAASTTNTQGDLCITLFCRCKAAGGTTAQCLYWIATR